MRRVYTLLLWLALPLVSLSVAWRGLRQRDYWHGWRERFGHGYRRRSDAERGLWLHAVSMGEVQAALPLVSALHARGVRLLLSSATPTGRRRARTACSADIEVRYAPYDLPNAVRRVLTAARPRLRVVLETELWPNTLQACAAAGVPVLIASARLSERTLVRLLRWQGLLPPATLANLRIAAQTEADAARYRRLGVPAEAIRVCGNLKFDRQSPPELRERGATLRRTLASDRALWVAGSTHAGEEPAVLDAQREATAAGLRPLLVLAPRHPHRFAEVATQLQAAGWRFARRTDGAGVASDVDVLLLDTMGELSDFYAAADLAYVGGSLVPVGGHNLLEPAELGVAVITGPGHETAPEVHAALRSAGGLVTVADGAALAGQVTTLLADPAARHRLVAAADGVLAASRGSLGRIVAWIDELLAAGSAG
jgi:3-deoxy-D-manno-octulosonic-acid transferase